MRQAFTELPAGWLATIQEQHLAVQKAVSSHPKAQDLNFESSANKACPRRKEAQGISQIPPHGPSVSPAGPDAPGTFGKTGALPLETAALTGVHGLCKKTHEPNHSQGALQRNHGSNAMSLWLYLQKTSTVSAPSCVNSKKNGSVVNEDPTKKRPEPKSDSPF